MDGDDKVVSRVDVVSAESVQIRTVIRAIGVLEIGGGLPPLVHPLHDGVTSNDVGKVFNPVDKRQQLLHLHTFVGEPESPAPLIFTHLR